MKIGIIDYGHGNLGSVIRALKELQAVPILVKNCTDVNNVDKLILPGVGNFSDCAKALEGGGWYQVLREEVLERNKPLLGICVGMQLLATIGMESSDSGIPGLNFIPGRVENLRTLGCNLRLPHVGWNEVITTDISAEEVFAGIPNSTDFYFVHSYVFKPDNPAHVIAHATYDVSLTAAIKCRHIWGTQFHPEKSSRAGFQLIRNFIESPKC